MEEASLLITGASGTLGWHLARYFQMRGWRVEGTYTAVAPPLREIRWHRLDLEEPDSVRRLAAGSASTLVIHAAALTRPDECQRHPRATRRVNVEGTQRLLEALDPRLFLYISTDLVFDGRRGHYTEEDPPHPLNHYAASKLEAEGAVLAHPGGRVVRLAKLYAFPSPGHSCFTGWMRERFERGRRLPLFRDQFRSPLYVGDAARALEALLEVRGESRRYHLGGPQRMSRSRFGRLFARAFGYDASLIDPVPMEEVEMAPRGRDCSLDSSRLCREVGFSAAPVQEGLSRLSRGCY